MTRKRGRGRPSFLLAAILLLGTVGVAAGEEATQLGFTWPETGASVRGTAKIEVGKSDPGGYVTFRIDDRFAYSTIAPFEMRWDTSTIGDGEHTIRAEGYDDSGAPQGTSSIRVSVANQVPVPEEGIKLTVRFRHQEILSRQITASGELGELALDETLPSGLEDLGGQLTASVSELVLDPFYKESRTLLRDRVRKGGLLVGSTQKELSEMGKYATVETSRNGLTLPVLSSPDRPRIPIAEISFALADSPVKRGDSWESPLGVVSNLVKRETVYVQARHTFDGLWWYQGRECAKIISNYSLPDIGLPFSGTFLSAQAGPAWEMELTQATAPSSYPAGGRGATSGLSYREQLKAARSATRAALRNRRSGLRGMQLQQLGLSQPEEAGSEPTGPQVVRGAKLTGLTGTRTTWLAIGSGTVIRTEDQIRGRLSFTFGEPGEGAAAGAPGMPAMPRMPSMPPAGAMSRFGVPPGMAGMPSLAGMRGAGAAAGLPTGVPADVISRFTSGRMSAEEMQEAAARYFPGQDVGTLARRFGVTLPAGAARPGTAGGAAGTTTGANKVPPSLTYSLTLVTQLAGVT